MKLLILVLIFFCSCSTKQHDGKDINPLPRYSDMGAAADAGRVTQETYQK
jgi:hypothetical protein